MPQLEAMHLVETGRIRIGAQVPIERGPNKGKPRPALISEFRLTSNSREALEAVAERYGGTVQAWTVRPEWKTLVRAPQHRWEVYTESDTLEILIEASMLMTRNFERWRGAACILRCNGKQIVKDATGHLVGRDCICPSDPQERKALAAKKPPEACEQVSRIQVLLAGIRGGQWRLDTHGFNADAETRALTALLRACQAEHMLIPAQMRLEQRTDVQASPDPKSADEDAYKIETRHYACVVIEPCYATDELLLARAQDRVLLPPGMQASPALLAAAATATADLYGDPLAWAQTTEGIAQMSTLEREIRANGGEVESWYAWAEKHFKKPRATFTVAEIEQLHYAVQAAAELRRGKGGAATHADGGETETPEAGASREPGDEGPDASNVQEPELPLT